MERPDAQRFSLFSRHLSSLDAVLYNFAVKNHFELLKNVKRQPGRELHFHGNPLLMSGIHLDGSWLKMEYEDDLPHNISVSAVYIAPDGKRFVKTNTLIAHQAFSKIQANIPDILDKSWMLLNSWREAIVEGDEDKLICQGWKQVYPRKHLDQKEISVQ